MNRNLIVMAYHYWVESRMRFVLALMLMIAMIVYAVGNSAETISQHPGTHAGRIINFTQYVWVILYKGYLLTIFTFSSFIFGLGGPMQEKVFGTALFTLSLPAFRTTIIRSKIIVAALQVIVLSITTAFALPVIADVYGFYYPVIDALLFSVLMSTGGLLFMLLSICLSLFISRPMLVPALGVAIMSALYFITRLPSLKWFNIFNFMCGAGYLNNDNFLFVGMINIPGILLIIFLSSLLVILFERWFKKIDF